MADCRFPCSSQSQKDSVCIETNRILDSCRDRDCFENVRVFLTEFGNDIIAHTTAVRARDAEIVHTAIGVDPIQFNRGFYSVSIRYFVRLIFEACVGNGHSQEFDGIAVLDKNVILYGGESNVRVFSSNSISQGFCSLPELCDIRSLSPTAVVEVVDPVILASKVTEEKSCCHCVCCCGDIPKGVASCLSSSLGHDTGERILTVSLGIFSVIRLTRKGQFAVNATEYAVPDKECFENTECDPCSVFRKMAFPVGEFAVPIAPPALKGCSDRPDKHCNC